MDIEEIMELYGEEPHDKSGELTPDQVELRLTEYFAQVYAEGTVERFEPGQLIWLKNPSLAPKRVTDRPIPFLGYLAEPVDWSTRARIDGGFAAARVSDCRVLVLGVPNRVFCELEDSREYTATRPIKPASPSAD